MRKTSTIAIAALVFLLASAADAGKSGGRAQARPRAPAEWKPFYKDPQYANQYRIREYTRPDGTKVRAQEHRDPQTGQRTWHQRAVIGPEATAESAQPFVQRERRYKGGKVVSNQLTLYWGEGSHSYSVTLKGKNNSRAGLTGAQIVHRRAGRNQLLSGPMDGPQQPNADLLQRFNRLLSKSGKSDKAIKRAAETVFGEARAAGR